MAFPDDIEPNIGLAGPTADIGHAAAHAASGTPRLFQAIQETIGTNTGTQTFTPTWTNGGTPSTNVIKWNRVGNMVAVSINFAWTASSTATGASLFGSYPAGWGSFNTTTIMGTGKIGSFLDPSVVGLVLSVGNASLYSYWSQDNVNNFRRATAFANGMNFRASGILVVG